MQRDAVKLWRVADGKLVRSFPETRSVSSISFSPDGQLMVVADWGHVKLLRVETGQVVHAWEVHPQALRGVAFSPESRIPLVASAGWDGTVRLWRAEQGQLLASLPGNSEPVNALAFSPDGRLLAMAGEKGLIRLWGVFLQDNVPAEEAAVKTVSCGRSQDTTRPSRRSRFLRMGGGWCPAVARRIGTGVSACGRSTTENSDT